jgi:hypothetical protein
MYSPGIVSAINVLEVVLELKKWLGSVNGYPFIKFLHQLFLEYEALRAYEIFQCKFCCKCDNLPSPPCIIDLNADVFG